MIVYFILKPPPNGITVGEIIEGIRELLYPGAHYVEKRLLDAAETYFGSEAWKTLWWLGREHDKPFNYCNGVVQTWSEYTLSQVMCMQSFGIESQRLPTPVRCA